MKKFVDKYWLELSIFVLSGVIAAVVLFTRGDVVDVIKKNNYFSVSLLFGGAAGSQLIIILKGLISSMAEFFDYQKRLHDLGIIKIYPKRRKTEQEKGGYYYELLEELKRLNSNNVQNLEKKIIKMIGVSLDKFFGTPFGSSNEDISSIIWELCKKMHFQVMICNPDDNSELNSRLNFINEELKKYYGNKGENWEDITKDNAPIFDEMKTSINNISTSKANGSKIDLCPYNFSPYATMIIIDDHIYYTPNVLEYKSYVPNEELPPEFAIEVELSMCIHRKSKYGERLEKLFDALWLCYNSDDSASKLKSKRPFLSWSK